MDRKPSNPETDSWVDERLASLAPSPEWTPNAHRALNQILTGQKTAGPRWMRLGMTATILATTVVVLALLPWQRLWTPDQTQKSAAAAVTQVEKQQTTPQAPAEQTEAAKATVPRELNKVSGDNLLDLPDNPEDLRAYLEGLKKSRTASGQLEAAKVVQEQEKAREAQSSGVLQPTEQKANLSKEARTQAEASAEGAAQSSGITQPAVVSRVNPEYTEEAKQAKILGTVELIVTIRTDGSVQFERIKSGLGYGLDEKAREAVEKWQFTPGMKDGVPVPTMIGINVTFSLR